MPSSSPRDAVVVGLLLAAALALLLPRLGGSLLWQDEAETALLARSVLVHGVPTAFDGRNVISQERMTEFDPVTHLWRWTPWLPHYLAAGSFALLGESAFSARLPFALLGAGCVALTWLLTLRLTRDRRSAWIAALVLLGSVPFLLYMRQCRYYAPASFFTLLYLLQYLRVLGDRPHAHWWMAVSAAGLFHSHYVLCAGVLLSTGLHALVVERQPGQLRRLALGWSASVIACAPFALLFFGHTAHRAWPGPAQSLARLGMAIDHLNLYAFPLILVLAVAAFWTGDAKQRFQSHSGELWLLPLVLLITSAFLAAVMPLFFFRYYAILIPIGAALQGVLVGRLWCWNAWVAGGLLLLLAGTDLVPHSYPLLRQEGFEKRMSLRTGDETSAEVVGEWARHLPMAAYLYELGHPSEGPLAAIVAHLDSHARPDDRVLITYGDLPLQFHTDLHVMGGRSGVDVRPHLDAEWIVMRAHQPWNKQTVETLRQGVDWERYEAITLDAIDIPFEHRPDPIYHKFRSVTSGAPYVVLHRRVE